MASAPKRRAGTPASEYEQTNVSPEAIAAFQAARAASIANAREAAAMYPAPPTPAAADVGMIGAANAATELNWIDRVMQMVGLSQGPKVDASGRKAPAK